MQGISRACLLFIVIFFRYLYATLQCESEKGFKALSDLEHLEEFIFFATAFGYCTLNERNMQLCLQYLPKLRNAGGKFFHGITPQQLQILGHAMTGQLLCAKKPLTLGLEQLTLLAVSSIPDGIFLPNLTSLHLMQPTEDFQWDSRMSAVSELNLQEVTMVECVQVLKKVGRQIKILYIDIMDSILVDKILQMCPRLERLYMVFTDDVIELASQIEPDTLQQLEVLELVREDGFYSDDCVDDINALLQLLQAPKLRQLKLRLISLRQEDVEEFDRRLQHGGILQKLEKATLELMSPSAPKDNFDQLMDKLNNSLVLCCPKLIKYGDL